MDWQRWVTAGSDSVPLFIGWEKGISERRSGKQMESFFFKDKVIFILILFVFFFQTAVERHLIYLDDEYEFAVELHRGLTPSGAGLTARLTQTDS